MRVTHKTYFNIAIKASPGWDILNDAMTYISDFHIQLKPEYSENEVSLTLIGFKGFDIDAHVRLNDLGVEFRRVAFDLYQEASVSLSNVTMDSLST